MAVTYDQMRTWVLALPGTSEAFVEKWGEFTLRCGDKILVIGDPASSYASVKASVDDQAELLAMAPDTYTKAAYVGRYGWVRVHLRTAEAADLRRVVEDAWRRTAPKRTVAAHDSAQGQPGQRHRGRDLDGRPDDVPGDAAEPADTMPDEAVRPQPGDRHHDRPAPAVAEPRHRRDQ